MLVDLQVYQEVFEIEFLHETETSYRAEALRMMRDPEFTVSIISKNGSIGDQHYTIFDC